MDLNVTNILITIVFKGLFTIVGSQKAVKYGYFSCFYGAMSEISLAYIDFPVKF